MITETEIGRSARELVEHYGREAIGIAQDRVEELRNRGDYLAMDVALLPCPYSVRASPRQRKGVRANGRLRFRPGNRDHPSKALGIPFRVVLVAIMRYQWRRIVISVYAAGSGGCVYAEIR